MSKRKTTLKTITLIVIIIFILATGGVAVLYLFPAETDIDYTETEYEPIITPVEQIPANTDTQATASVTIIGTGQ